MPQALERKMVVTSIRPTTVMYTPDGLPYINDCIIHCEGTHDSFDFHTIFPEHYPIGSIINVSISNEESD